MSQDLTLNNLSWLVIHKIQPNTRIKSDTGIYIIQCLDYNKKKKNT